MIAAIAGSSFASCRVAARISGVGSTPTIGGDTLAGMARQYPRLGRRRP
jgi:hypothetical protein